MAILKRAVTSNATGAVHKYGRTDFAGQFDPGSFTQLDLVDGAHLVDGLPLYHHKVVAADLVEMTGPEKAAADAEHEAELVERLAGAARVTLKVASPAALPVPPPGPGYLVGIENVSGSPALAISTATGYIIFLASGTYP